MLTIITLIHGHCAAWPEARHLGGHLGMKETTLSQGIPVPIINMYGIVFKVLKCIPKVADAAAHASVRAGRNPPSSNYFKNHEGTIM